MNRKEKERLISEQQNYLDFVCAEHPYRRLAVSDKSNARYELAQLRAALNEARIAISHANDFISSINRYDNGTAATLCRAWLAAHPETK